MEALFVRLLESVFAVSSPDPAAMEALRRDWSRCLTSEPRGEATPVDLGPVSDKWRRGHQLTSELTVRALGAAAGRLVMFHACGLAHEGGGVTALVGPSGAGKTTAARVLCRDSYGYVSDEVVAMDAEGGVLALPRPLAATPSGATTRTKVQYGPDALGLKTPPPLLHLARIVLIHREVGSPSIRSLPLVDAVLALVPHTSYLGSLDLPLQRLAEAISRTRGVFRATYETVSELQALLVDAAPDGTEDWHPAGTWMPGDVLWALMDGKVRRAPYSDAISVENETVVLIANTPFRLSGIGASIWRQAAEGLSVDALVTRITAEFGSHPEARALVLEAVRSLTSHGVMVQGRPRTVASLLTGDRMTEASTSARATTCAR